MQCLVRRLNLPQSMLHRWIRTGQIRCNGGRCKPFDQVSAGDMVRLPPFAPSMHASTLERQPAGSTPQSSAQAALPPLIHSDAHLLVFNKPAGLPVHTGTGHSDSLATRLALHHVGAPFAPTPAHRLDKDTSGLLMVALSYATLRALQEAFKERSLGKEYLAWVHGSWPHDMPQLLTHRLDKRYTGSDEKVHALPPTCASPDQASLDQASLGQASPDQASLDQAFPGQPSPGKESLCVVSCLHREADPHAPHGLHAHRAPWQGRSLMHIRLLTGRTHQIRVQLAAEGHPLCGDSKYGAPPSGVPLRLHALRLTLPPVPALSHLPCCLEVLPPWEGPWQVRQMPAPLTVPLA